MTRITLDQANRIIAAAFAHAAEAKYKPLAAVVVDAGGHVIAYQRQDGASTGRFQIALGKVSGALMLGLSSRKIADMAAERPTFIASLGPIAAGGLIPAAGGVIVVDADNQPIGGVGISGDLSDNDEKAVLAGIMATGLSPQA